MSQQGRPGGPRRGQPLPLHRRAAIMMASAGVTLALLALAVLAAGLWFYFGPGPAGPNGGTNTVVLRPGARLMEIAASLERGHAVSSGPVFVAAAQLSGAARHLKAGEYAFPSHASMSQVMAQIRRGDVVVHRITIPEGLTSQQAVDILMASDVLTGAAPIPAEGSILPETYEVTRGEDRAAVLQRMMSARDDLLRTLWAQRREDLPFASPAQAVVLASIVEKETGTASERPRVAAVFVNRLQKGMRLESDPTVVYGITGGPPLGHLMRQSELQTESPYNTYLNAGLPVGPICNPGRAALAAALDPPRTDELYFVANGTGGHSFSATLEQHQQNVAHWRQIEHAVRGAPAPGAAPTPATAPARGGH